MVPLPSSRLLVLACSATKRDGPDYMPAIERYDGPLWRTLRAADPGGTSADVAFLSAHYGFRDARTPIEIYDRRMTEETAIAMKAGGLATRWPRPKTKRRVMPSGDHPGMHIASMTAFRQRPFADVGLAGGHLYLDVMRHLIGLFREGGYITSEARITEINGSIGLMRRDLRLWLHGDDGEGR